MWRISAPAHAPLHANILECTPFMIKLLCAGCEAVIGLLHAAFLLNGRTQGLWKMARVVWCIPAVARTPLLCMHALCGHLSTMRVLCAGPVHGGRSQGLPGGGVSGVARISACARITALRVRAAWTPLTTTVSGWAPAWAPATMPCALLHCSALLCRKSSSYPPYYSSVYVLHLSMRPGTRKQARHSWIPTLKFQAPPDLGAPFRSF